MRKISSFTVNWIIILIMVGLLVFAGIEIYQEHKESDEPDQNALILDSNIIDKETMMHIETREKLLIEFLSVNYLEDKEYLIRVEVGGKQVGIIYFDENGEIRFDGDREKFEDAIFKAFDARRVK